MILNDRYHLNILYQQSISERFISFSCSDLSADSALRQMCKVNGLSLSVFDGVYYISGDFSSGHCVRVYRVSASDLDDYLALFEKVLGDNGTVSVCGSSLVVFTDSDKHIQLNQLKEVLSYNSNQTYLAEVYFLRLKRRDYLDLSADLSVKSVDLLGVSDLSDLFALYLKADTSKGLSTVDQRPVVYLTDGQESLVNVGSEIVKSENTVSSEGVSSVTGYKTFNDGLDLSLTPHKIDSDFLSLDVSLSVSTFDQSDSGAEVPKSDKTKIESKGQIIRDGSVVYLGSVDRRDFNKGFRFFGVNQNNNADVLSIWLRVRSVK